MVSKSSRNLHPKEQLSTGFELQNVDSVLALCGLEEGGVIREDQKVIFGLERLKKCGTKKWLER